MSSSALTSNKNLSRNGRQSKAALATTMVDVPISQGPPILAPTPIRTERRRRPSKKIRPSDIPVLDQQPQTESPALPQLIEQGVAPVSLSNSESAVVSGKKPKKKKLPNNHQTNGNANSSTSTPRNNRSPRPELRATSMTPVRKTTTSSQAYAGPTFHASPAPSALPIPKFFSKSVPVNEKGASLSTMMQDDPSEGFSNNSEDSPTMQKSLRVSQQPTREASPLDFFFNADREEKAKRSSIITNGAPNQNSDQPLSAPKSVSPIPKYMRHHSRNVTGSSTNEIFPLEMDASERSSPIKAIRPSNPSPDSRRSESSPSIITMRSAQSEEQAKAKTEALKRFLLSSQFQSPSSKLTSPSGSLECSSSPSPSPTAYHNYNHRSTSAMSTPRVDAGSPSYGYRNQSSDSDAPYLKQSPIATAKGLSQTRPLSSHLRQEMTAEMFPEPKELPSTPTPSRSYNVYNPTATQNSHNVQHNSSFSHFTPEVKNLHPEDALKASTGQKSTSVDMMENELRRILKLDHLGSGGATGVRS